MFVGDGNGTFKAGIKYAMDTYPSSMVVADFNGDGELDLAMTGAPSVNFPSNVISLLLGNGDGTFGSLTTPFAIFGVGDLPYSAAVGDFNGDGAKDLAVANSGSNTVSVLLNTQGTNMSAVSSGNPSSFGQSITFTTTIAASVPSGAAPSGTVTLSTGSSVLGSGDFINGAFAFSTSALPVGVESISAVYSGHSNYQPHTISLTQTVQQAATITSLLSSADPSQPNQSVTFTAKVLPIHQKTSHWQGHLHGWNGNHRLFHGKCQRPSGCDHWQPKYRHPQHNSQLSWKRQISKQAIRPY